MRYTFQVRRRRLLKFLAQGQGTPPLVVPAGIIGWWLLSDGKGLSAKDSSGAGNDGTLIGSPTWVSGPPKALQFSGANYVDCPLRFTASVFSLCTQIYLPSGYSFSGNPRIVANSHADTGSTGFELFMPSAGSLDFALAGSYNIAFSQSVSISPNAWHSIVVTYDGSNCLMYFDGNVIHSRGGSTSLANSGNDVTIARAAYNGDFFTGSVRDVRIYNRAITQTEVTAILNGTG